MNKWITYAQVAFKANKICLGSKLLPSIQNQTAKLVIYSNQMGQNTKKKILDKCRFYEIPCFGVDQTEFDHITKRSFVAFSITDRNLASRILEQRKGTVISDGLQQTKEKTQSESQSAK